MKPFKKKQWSINSIIEPLIFKEVQKLPAARIILPIRHSTWVANMAPVRKKNGDIRFCVDFLNLNKAS